MFSQTPVRFKYPSLMLFGWIFAFASTIQASPAEESAAAQFETQAFYLPYAEKVLVRVQRRTNVNFGMNAWITPSYQKMPVSRRKQIAEEMQGLWFECLRDNGSSIKARKWATLTFWDSSGRCVANTVGDKAPFMWVRDDAGQAKLLKEGQKKTATYTPAIGSAERKAIFNALRKSVQIEAKGSVVFVVHHFKVSRGWAYLDVDAMKSGANQKPVLWARIRALCRLKGKIWENLTYGWDSKAMMKEAIITTYPSVPRSILK